MAPTLKKLNQIEKRFSLLTASGKKNPELISEFRMQHIVRSRTFLSGGDARPHELFAHST
jgi:hypothetical protein